ncbi:MAG: phosphoribosylformylglycinamidine synthase subunit PurQ [Nitrospinae bacterium]|nr:phosphoribosylformylglycinamidine synthase subunit PurQ [Nitrospinota bacterium]
MRCGVVVFPGSNCDHDTYNLLKELGCDVQWLWHKEREINNIDVVFVPGGFSYGDYLRAGSIARFSPIVDEIKSFAGKGGYVVGICNGFQVLVESHMLPGALMHNNSGYFICQKQYLKVENNSTVFTSGYDKGQVVNFPIAHGEGKFYADDEVIKELEDNDSIIFRYSNKKGEVSGETNPNGSRHNIAGICNKKGNILGLMPHPERSSSKLLGCEDGLPFFQSIMNSLK